MFNGLENVGRNLVGDGQWEVLYPHDWREEAGDQRTPDFDPAQVGHEPADTQELNNSDLPHIEPSETPEEEVQEEKNELLENFFHLLPYWYFINRAFGSSSKDLDLSNLNPAQLLSAHTAALNSNPDNDHLNQNQNSGENNPLLEALDAQRLNSLLFFESLKQLQLQQQHGGAPEGSFGSQSGLPFFSGEMLEELSKRSRKGFNDPLPQTLPGLSILNNNLDHTDDQPLDLTQKNKKCGSSSDERPPPPLLWGGQLEGSLVGEKSVTSSCVRKKPPGLTPDQVGRIAKASPRPASQRAGKGYTTQELEAALRDIQSGKLGTRRAAVIYGIPRSTLRNKVYKMGKDRSRPYFRQNNPLLSQESHDDPVGHQMMPAINAHLQLLPKNEKNNIPNTNYTTILGSTLIKRNSNSNGKNNNNHFSDEEPDDEYEDDEVDQKQHLSSLLSSHLNNNNCIKKLDCRSEKQQYNEENDDQEKEMSNGYKRSPGVEDDGSVLGGGGGDEISHEKKVLKEWLQSKLQSKQSEMILRGAGDVEGFGGGDQSDNSSENSDLSSRGKESGRRDVILKIPSLINNKSSLSNSKSNSGGATTNSRYNSMISQGSGRRKLGKINRNVVDNLGEDSDLPLVINKRIDEERGGVSSDMEEDRIERDQDFGGECGVVMKRIKLDPNIFERDEDGDGDGDDGEEDADVDCRLSGVGGLEYDTAKLLYHRKKSLLKQMMSSTELSPQSSSSFLNQQFASSLSSNNNNNNSNDANGKKSRPKRGKYRNYDRDALLKAVRAVQAGEMSVHRAGSFFGVPHSTLEYKVKERHLLRRPKRKGLIQQQAPSSPKSSLHCKSSPDSSDGSDAQSSLNFQQNHLGGHMPDLRESLSRYLILGGQIPPSSQSQSHYPSNASSPDPTNNNSTPKGKNSNENSGDLVIRPSSRSPCGVVGTPPPPVPGGGKNYRTIESLKNLGRGGGGAGFASSPFLNIFQLDDLLRQNLENNSSHLNNSTSTNSLLDLSKKS